MEMMETNLPRRNTSTSSHYNLVTLNAYWFGVSFMWNAIHPLVLPMLLLSFDVKAKNTLYGLLTFLGLIIALLVQPLSGALSDYTRHRWGRRRPWIVAGTVLDLFFLALLALSESPWGVASAYILLQFSSNLAHGPAQGLIPDLVPQGKRGGAAGAKSFIDMLGVIAAALAVSRVVGGTRPRPLLALGLVAAVLVAAAGITCWGIREPSVVLKAPTTTGPLWQRCRQTFHIDLHGQRVYGKLLLARFFLLLGVFAVQSFGLYYFHDMLPLLDPARVMGNLMIVIGFSILATSYPAGVLSERWGRKTLSLVACTIAATGLGALAFARSVVQISTLGVFIGAAMGIFASVNWAWATDLAPAQEAAKYLGISNLATAGSAAICRFLGPLIDALNGLEHGAGYLAMFLLAAGGAAVALGIIWHMPDSPRSERAVRLLPAPTPQGESPESPQRVASAPAQKRIISS